MALSKLAPHQSEQNAIQELDPIKKIHQKEKKSYLQILKGVVEPKRENVDKEGRRFIILNVNKGLEKDFTDQFVEKIRSKIRTAGFFTYVYSYWIEHIEDGRLILYYKNTKEARTPWFNNINNVKIWLKRKEAERLSIENIHMPDTKWMFRGFADVDLKIILAREPLLGTGPLPDWLRNLAHGARGQAMVALDTYRDNLCLWRCIAVYQGAKPDRSTNIAKKLAKGFLKLDAKKKTSLDDLEKVEKHLNKGKPLEDWLGFRVYEPIKEGDTIHWSLKRASPERITKIITIGVYDGHAFLIKNIDKLAKIYRCCHSNARFTQSWNLQRHNKRCTSGETIVYCPATKS